MFNKQLSKENNLVNFKTLKPTSKTNRRNFSTKLSLQIAERTKPTERSKIAWEVRVVWSQLEVKESKLLNGTTSNRRLKLNIRITEPQRKQGKIAYQYIIHRKCTKLKVQKLQKGSKRSQLTQLKSLRSPTKLGKKAWN